MIRRHIDAAQPATNDVATLHRPKEDTDLPIALHVTFRGVFDPTTTKKECYFSFRFFFLQFNLYFNYLMYSCHTQWCQPESNSHVFVAKRPQRMRWLANIRCERTRQHIACPRRIRQMMLTIVLIRFIKFSVGMTNHKRFTFINLFNFFQNLPKKKNRIE